MAYVPQFIPTQPQVFQGVLDQYQKAYDTETERFNQARDVYSAIPANNPIDIAAKNEVMQKFQTEVIDGLDKKYNYDRANSQYAKELASNISKLRSNPLWGLMQQKDEVNKMRRDAQLKLGDAYWESSDPNTATVEDPSALTNWRVKDLNELNQLMAASAKEYATSIKSNRPQTMNIGNGYMRIIDQFGFKNADEAARWLNDTAGQKWLTDKISSTGFDPQDPAIRARATQAALTQLVGEPKYDDVRIESLSGKGSSSSDGTTTGSGLTKVSNQKDVTSVPYPTTKASKLSDVQTNLKDLDTKIATAKPADKQVLQAQRAELALQKDRAIAVRQNVEKVNFERLEKGSSIVRQMLEKNPEYNQLSDVQKEVVQETLFNNLLNDHLYENASTRRGSVYIVDPKTGTFKLEKNIGHPLGPKVTKKGFVEPKELTEFNKWYKGEGDYRANGYNYIEDTINNELKKGEQLVFDVYSPKVDTKSAEYTQQLDFAVNNMKNFMPLEEEYRQGGKNGVEWDSKKLQKLNQQLATPGTTIQYLFNNDDQAYIQLSHPGNKDYDPATVTLKVDPNRSGMDVYESLAEYTGEPRFLDAQHSGFNIAENKKYEGNELAGAISKHPYFMDETGKPDMTGLEGVSVVKTKGNDGRLSYNVYLGEGDTSPEVFTTKDELLSTLRDYAMPDKIMKKSIKAASKSMASNTNDAIDVTDIKDIQTYAEAIGKKESGNNYFVRDNIHTGAIGKYQFMPSTIEGLGYDIDEFRSNPDLQDQAMVDLINQNIDILRQYGYNIDVNNLTPEAIALLSAAHYGGWTAAIALAKKKPWIYDPQIEKDAKGKETKYPSVADYMADSMGLDIDTLNFDSLK